LTKAFTALAAVILAASVGSEAHAADNKQCIAASDSGQDLRDKGRLVEARELFRTCAQSSCPQPVPKYCAQWLDEVTRKLPSIVVRAVDASGKDVVDANATIDDKPVVLDGHAIDVDPGKHRVHMTRAGLKPFDETLLIAEGEKARVIVGRLDMEGAPPPPAGKEPERTRVPALSWVGWGIGAAGILGFTVFGLKAKSDYDGFESTCAPGCGREDRDSVATSSTIADVSLVVGLVAAAAGTIIYFTHPNGPR
jgi:hypothetical protein